MLKPPPQQLLLPLQPPLPRRLQLHQLRLLQRQQPQLLHRCPLPIQQRMILRLHLSPPLYEVNAEHQPTYDTSVSLGIK